MAGRAASAIAIAVTLSAAEGRAQSGFAVNRFEPAERGSQPFVVDSLEMRPGHAAAGATLDYAYKPLVIYDATGSERAAIVRHQAIAHLGGSLVVAERLRLALDAPVALYQDGEGASVGAERLTAATAPAMGDVRLAADVRVLGHQGAPLSLALGARGWLPTGVSSQLMGDGALRVAPQVLAAGAIGPLGWAARVAFVYRAQGDAYAGRALGSELHGSAGVGLRALRGRLWAGPELSAASALSGGAFLGRRETPLEWLLGARYDILPSLRGGAAVGSGIGHGDGAPALRAIASIEWVTPASKDERTIAARVEAPTPWEGAPPAPAPEPAPRPLAVVRQDEIHIEEEIRFATDSADLIAESDAVLGAVQRVLDDNPSLRIRVEGHTDSTGDPAYNDDLSARRAASVQSWLVAHGIAEGRLESTGLGSRQPIDTNDTESGRARNRRVVFRILDR